MYRYRVYEVACIRESLHTPVTKIYYVECVHPLCTLARDKLILRSREYTIRSEFVCAYIVYDRGL